MLFLDVLEFNIQNPIYVSIVRNPIDRLSSWYYYQRTSMYMHGTYFSNVMDAKRSFEDCVTGKIDECTFEIGINIFDAHYWPYQYKLQRKLVVFRIQLIQ